MILIFHIFTSFKLKALAYLEETVMMHGKIAISSEKKHYIIIVVVHQTINYHDPCYLLLNERKCSKNEN